MCSADAESLRTQAIERQAAAGVAEADCIVLVVDGQSGVTGADEEIVTWLRRTHPSKPVLLLLADIRHSASQQKMSFVRHPHGHAVRPLTLEPTC